MVFIRNMIKISGIYKEKEITNSLEVLTELYTNNDEESIERLKKCRLNPDFDPKTRVRTDLEFFVLQLWSFLNVFFEF